jgi:hypothetical protein
MSGIFVPRWLPAFLGSCIIIALTTVLVRIPDVYAGSTDSKVTPWQAMKAAVGKLPGSTAYSATYAREGGHWLYDVIVIKNGKLMEIEVDAVTGKAGDTEAATPEQEGRELTEELHKALDHSVKPGKKSHDEKDEKDEK